jgi:hypothetical protein
MPFQTGRPANCKLTLPVAAEFQSPIGCSKEVRRTAHKPETVLPSVTRGICVNLIYSWQGKVKAETVQIIFSFFWSSNRAKMPGISREQLPGHPTQNPLLVLQGNAHFLCMN